MDIEAVCETVHKAYCDERVRQGREPYWTGGDYSKLNEAAKDYDRATVQAVLGAIGFEQLQAELAKANKEIEQLKGNDCVNIDCSNHVQEVLLEKEQLQAEIADLTLAVKEWRTKADSELHINAELQSELAKLKKWQVKPTEAICLTDLSCRHKKVFRND